MSSEGIIVETGVDVKIEGKDAVIVIPKLSTPIVNKPPFSVKVSPRTYSIVSPDIYTIKRNSALDPFFEDQINNIIDTGNLADEVADLDNRFGNFQDGVTLEIGYLKDADTKLAYDLSVVKVSNDTNTAGIQNLDITKVTEDEAIAISNATIGAWQTNGTGGAWFNEQVSTVSNVAYSAAKSASTLTASINSQQDQLNLIAGDIDILQSQVDGKVETWSGQHEVSHIDGSIIETAEPYATWLAGNEVARHTGDTYLKTELAVGGERLLETLRFVGEGDSPIVYRWAVFSDDLASKAYQEAIDAGILADGKINTFYQTFAPDSIINPTLGEGDLWLDSDDNNKMYRYQGNPLDWVEVENKKIEASVKRLDEATVNVDGTARAKSSLVIDANGVASGFVGESDGATSSFKIFADNFAIVGQGNIDALYPPFSVDTQSRQINFNGRVSFNNVDDKGDLVERDDLEGSNGTVIDGSAIRTGTINADRFTGNTVWVDGSLRSVDYNLNAPYTSGFLLDTLPAAGNPNIYGAYIKGGVIEGTTIKLRDLILTNDADYQVNSIVASSSIITRVDPPMASGTSKLLITHSIYPYNSTHTTTNKLIGQSADYIVFGSKYTEIANYNIFSSDGKPNLKPMKVRIKFGNQNIYKEISSNISYSVGGISFESTVIVDGSNIYVKLSYYSAIGKTNVSGNEPLSIDFTGTEIYYTTGAFFGVSASISAVEHTIQAVNL